jgi:UDP-N-acetylmuramate--alanine ligase
MKPSLRFHRLHFIGIGGSGMSSMAEILVAWGFQVSGSDSKSSEALDKLKLKGIRVEVGHQASNIGDAQAVVYSSAVPANNSELVEARRIGISVLRRAEMLGEILRGKYAFGVAGTHGKTTTTTMLGCIWLHAGTDPTLLAGGTTRGENLSAVAGQGPVFIFEADEFDRSFLAMRPTSAIIGNIDSDHLDCYGTLDAVREAFVAFAKSLPAYGLLIVNADDEGVKAVLPKLSQSFPRIVAFGQSDRADYRAINIGSNSQGMVFSLEKNGVSLGAITLQVHGMHNVYNALAAASLSLEEGRSFKEVAYGLKEYQGVKRRLEFRGKKAGVAFYDDYAHHPTEVAAALQAVRTLGSGRVVAVFQPHLYSRTQQLYQAFAEAFKACDILFVTAIFPARELPIAGVEGMLISNAVMAGIMPATQVHYVDNLAELSSRITPLLKPEDVLITMGAGDIGLHCGYIMEAWK